MLHGTGDVLHTVDLMEDGGYPRLLQPLGQKTIAGAVPAPVQLYAALQPSGQNSRTTPSWTPATSWQRVPRQRGIVIPPWKIRWLA